VFEDEIYEFASCLISSPESQTKHIQGVKFPEMPKPRVFGGKESETPKESGEIALSQKKYDNRNAKSSFISRTGSLLVQK
jgi:hypothetical protein